MYGKICVDLRRLDLTPSRLTPSRLTPSRLNAVSTLRRLDFTPSRRNVAVLGTNYEVISEAESVVFCTCHKVCCYANLELIGGRSGVGACGMFFHATVQCIFWIRSGIAVTCYGGTNVILYSFLAIVTYEQAYIVNHQTQHMSPLTYVLCLVVYNTSW